MRRVRRAGAAGAAASRPERKSGGAKMASGNDEKLSGNGAGAAAAAVGGRASTDDDGAGPSLSERLRMEPQQQQQQQLQRQQPRRKGPLSDADHTALSSSSARNQPRPPPPSAANNSRSSSGASIDSGWSWESSSRTSGWSWASSSKGDGGSIRGKYAPVAAGGAKLATLKSKRKWNAVRSAFGDERTIQEQMLSAMNCRREQSGNKNGGGEKPSAMRQPSSGQGRAAKIGLAMLLAVGGMFQLGRRRGHRVGAPSKSMSDVYLRGHLPSSSGSSGKQKQSTSYNNSNTIVHQAYFPTHLSHLSNLTAPYDAAKETPYFWDVHFSGESVAEAVFATCHGLVAACEFGLRQPGYDAEKLGVFPLDGAKYVNVDLTTAEGIDRAARLGLASSGLADVIVSPRFHDVASTIFSATDQGRMFALFRHPVDRALGMYYYLARASWDPQYNPALARTSIEDYARSKYIESNWMTRFLVGKARGTLTHADMLLAKKILKFKCLVGLYDDLEASLARFERYFGWHGGRGEGGDLVATKAETAKCRAAAVLRGDKNVLGHPISLKEGQSHGMSKSGSPAVRAGSVAWNAIVRMNAFDMELYSYATKIYRVQGEQIFDVVGHEVIPAQPANLGAGSGEDRAAVPEFDGGMVEDAFDEGAAAPQSGKSMAAALDANERKEVAMDPNDGIVADSVSKGQSSILDGDESGSPDSAVDSPLSR